MGASLQSDTFVVVDVPVESDLTLADVRDALEGACLWTRISAFWFTF